MSEVTQEVTIMVVVMTVMTGDDMTDRIRSDPSGHHYSPGEDSDGCDMLINHCKVGGAKEKKNKAILSRKAKTKQGGRTAGSSSSS